jgi:hypothetical protein
VGAALSLKYWEIIADNLKEAEWSLGCVSAVDSEGQTIWIADAHGGSRLPEVASVLMRCDHVASVIVNADHSSM